MKKKLQAESLKLKVRKGIFLFFIFLLFTFHFSLSTVFADEVSSKAAVVMQASTGRILFAKNPNLKLPPASTTKLVTAMVVLDDAHIDDKVTISKKTTKIPSMRKIRLRPGETVTVGTLLYAALLKSANDAAFALAESIAGSEKNFVELMNEKTMVLGAFDTRFVNTTGLPGRGQNTTAYDLAKIMRYALEYPLLKEIIGTKEAEISTEEGRIIPIKNTNRLLWSDEGAVGGKTGYTREAKHCFTFAKEKEGEMIIVAILGAPNRSVMWDEAERLAEKGFGVIENNDQPIIYFTKADYQSVPKRGVKKRAYSKNNKLSPNSISLKKKSKDAQGKNKYTRNAEKDDAITKNTVVANNRKYGNKG